MVDMAGSVFITQDNIWSTGSVSFCLIIDRTEDRFRASEVSLFKEAYSPLYGGLGFIQLDELDSSSFCVFYKRCKEAFGECQEQKSITGLQQDYYKGVMGRWSDLLLKLAKDERFNATWCE